MSRNYNAFLIRHWSLDSDRGDRIEVVHVQSGDRSLVTSLAHAATWMRSWVASDDAPERAPPAESVQDDPPSPTKQRTLSSVLLP